MKLLYLLPDLGYSAAARRVSLLAPALPRDRFTPHVAVLGRAGPLAEPLRAAGVPVHELGGRRADPRALPRLYRLLRELRPDAVHAWRLPAARAAALFAFAIPHLIVSEADRGGRSVALDRWLLHLAGARRAELPPAAEPPVAHAPGSPVIADLPPDARLIVCVGALTPAHGFRDAVWGFDVLRYACRDLHLVIVGDGPERANLERFGRAIGGDDWRIHFVPARPDAAALLARAAAVWVPSRRPCGEQVAAEALAAGVPVVASRLPGLAEVVGDAGLLVPPGDRTEMAKQTRRLLDDEGLRLRLGEAGRRRAAERFGVAALVRRAVELYLAPRH
jgi:glycosyltransferase involved in cell wall biosynthesis